MHHPAGNENHTYLGEADMESKKLLVNGLKHPYGIGRKPVFSWKMSAAEEAGAKYGAAQSAYRVIVCSDAEKAQQEQGDLWDSGKVESENPYDVVYGGEKLASKTTYFWRVQTWDEKGETAGFSETASFATGICDQSEWQGCWIGAGDAMEKLSRRAPIFRKEFEVKGKMKDARLFISGLGLFEAQINGSRPDDSVLNPGNTQYTTTVPYCAYDVTGLLKEGKNAIGVELGNNFYNEHTGVWKWQTAKWRDDPKLLLNLDINYEDGSRETVVTDTSWKLYTNGPTLENSIYLGDTYDANLAVEGYSEAGFDDSQWLAAREVQAPAGKLTCQIMPPVRRVCSRPAKTVEKTGPSTWIITSPETMTGWAKIRMKAAAGKAVTITYAETVGEDGRVPMTGNGQGECGEWWPEGIIQQDKYISDGAERFWEPRYSYKGYRYIQVDGYEEEMTTDDVICYCLANDVEQISDFKCSDPVLEKLHDNMRRTMRNNFQWKPTDTPIWEKNGWLGDANVSLPTMFYQFDIRHMMKHFVDLMDDCFHEYGNVPVIVPTADWGTDNTPVWNTIFVFATELLYDYYGQLETVRELYPDLKKYALNNIEECKSYGWTWMDEQLADWVTPMGDTMQPTDGSSNEGAGICGSVFVYRMLASMKRLAALVGAEEDIPVYQQAREQIYDAFQKKFWNAEESLYDTGYWKPYANRSKYRQNSNLLPVSAGLVPAENVDAVMKGVVQDIEKKGGHMDVGCVGTQVILPVLTDCGYEDVAWKLLKQDTYPSWGYWLSFDADCMWEGWEFASRSRDHYFLGTCDEYFYSHLCGVRSVKDGAKNITLKPVFLSQLSHAETCLQTVRGKLESGWKREEDGRICMNVKVPYGAAAQIYLPAGKVEIAKGQEGITFAQTGETGSACGENVLTAVSGAYTIYIGSNIAEEFL